MIFLEIEKEVGVKRNPPRDHFDGYLYYISSVGRVFDMLNNLHVWVFVK
jgi:hypothetical protein